MRTDVTNSKISEGIEIIFTILRSKWQDVSFNVCGGLRVCANIQLMTWDYNPEFTTDYACFCNIDVRIQMST